MDSCNGVIVAFSIDPQQWTVTWSNRLANACGQLSCTYMTYM